MMISVFMATYIYDFYRLFTIPFHHNNIVFGKTENLSSGFNKIFKSQNKEIIFFKKKKNSSRSCYFSIFVYLKHFIYSKINKKPS